jgi:transcriptional regulator with XRE-family HTH domain
VSPEIEIFGQVIRENRERRELSQEALAFESGLDRSYISSLEHGKYRATVSTVFAIARVFKMRPSELIRAVEERLDFVE